MSSLDKFKLYYEDLPVKKGKGKYSKFQIRAKKPDNLLVKLIKYIKIKYK